MSFSRLSAFVLVATLAACGGEENNATSNSTTGGNNMTTAGNNMSTAGNNTSTSGNNTSTSGNNTSTPTNSANSTTGTNNTTPPMCAGDTPTACFVNDDCSADQRCEDPTGTDTPCCVVGARGAGVTGDMCASENDCASGLCVGRNDDPEICSNLCSGPDDCPMDLECHDVLGMCVTPG